MITFSEAETPTLLVFTLGPARESARRRLLPGHCGQLEESLHRQGLESALDAGRRAGCKLRIWDRVRQRGRGFGARLRNAISDCKSSPGRPLLVVGTDAPGLTAKHLEAALAALEEDPERVVLGPSPDGGFYLLATTRPLDRELSAVRWCRPDTLKTLLRALKASGARVELLEPLADLDRRADLEAWLSSPVAISSLWRGLIRQLQEALASLRRPSSARTMLVPARVPVSSHRRRAPPRLV